MSPTRKEPAVTAPRESLYRLLVESVTGYAILVLDPYGRIASWNPGAERIKGWTEEEVVGRHYRLFFPPEAREAGEPEAQLERAKREGRFEIRAWRLRKDGTRFWAHVVMTALYQDGELVGFGKVTGDRTEEQAAKQKLVQRERQLAEAQQIAHLGSWELDPETGEVGWSKELYRIFGLTPDTPVSMATAMDRIDPAHREDLRALVDRALATGEPYAYQYRIRRPNGEERWIQTRGERVSTSLGDRYRLRGTALDITDLMEAEEQARTLAAEQAARAEAERTLQRMGFLAEASALLGGSLEYRDTLKTVAWLAVPPFADLCAVDIVGPQGRLHRLAVAHMDPERVELVERIRDRYAQDLDAPGGVAEVIRTGEPELLETIDAGTLEDLAQDGDHLAMLQQLELASSMVVPIRIRERSLGAISFAFTESDRRYTHEDLVVAQELAERAALAIENAQLHNAERDARKRAERATERITRLQAITAELSEAVTPQAVARAVVDHGVPGLNARSGTLALLRPDGSIELVRSVGISGEIEARYHVMDRDASVPVAEAIRTGELVVVESLAERDARFPELASQARLTRSRAMVAVPLRTTTGVIGSLGFGYAEERTFGEEDRAFLMALGRQCVQALERAWLYETEHAAREAAEEASRAKSQFVAMMSHELRTPLSAIIGYQELLVEEIAGPVNSMQKEQLSRIRASATHLRDIINQILSLSRIEAGKEEVLHDDVDLARLTRDVTVLLAPEAEAKGLTLEARIPESEVELETDAGKIRQILLNLISNAIKFTASGSVTVTLEPGDREVRIRVADTGIGIEPEDQERIFDVFTQVDQSTTRQAGGSGLGLAVSRRLARLLGGDLTLESEREVGTTFTLRLPT